MDAAAPESCTITLRAWVCFPLALVRATKPPPIHSASAAPSALD
jgi:hypothetical protein